MDRAFGSEQKSIGCTSLGMVPGVTATPSLVYARDYDVCSFGFLSWRHLLLGNIVDHQLRSVHK